MDAVQKTFTPEEATRMLPLVGRIVDNILTDGKALHALKDPDPTPWRLGDLLKDVNICVHELRQLGCTFKEWDSELGLVDFPAIIEGKEVLLCWRSDEAAVTHYHSHDEGYNGRKPIPSELLHPSHRAEVSN